MSNARDERQVLAVRWGMTAFGVDQTFSVSQRAIRFFEEAVELFQACRFQIRGHGGEIADEATHPDVSREMAHKIVDFVFDRESGSVWGELGGVGLTMLALAQACSISADEAEAAELQRVLSYPTEHFTKRNEAKNAAGLKAE